MKKVLFLIIALISPLVVFAAGTITKDGLKNAYKYMLECSKDGNHTMDYVTLTFGNSFAAQETIICKDGLTGSSININEYMTDDTIYYYAGSKKEAIKYEIRDDGKVVFTSTFEVTKDMSYDDLTAYEENAKPLFGYVIAAVAGGMKYGDALIYINTYLDDTKESSADGYSYVILDSTEGVEAQEGSTVIAKSEFSNYIIKYCKDTIGDKPISIDDGEIYKSFALNVSYDFSDANKYTKKFALAVYPTSEIFDFSSGQVGVGSLGTSKNALDPEINYNSTTETQTTQTTNPSTGTFMNVIMIVLLSGLLLFILLKNRNYYNKI